MIGAQVLALLWRLGYLLLFGTAAVVCFGAMYQSLRIKDVHSRWGLLSTLTFAGIWASLHVLYLATASPVVQYGALVLAIIAGLCVLASWLYFCAAYTRRSIHRNATARAIVLLLLAALAVSMVTNPLHDLWFTTAPVDVPFPRLGIVPTPWGTGLLVVAYALAAAGAVAIAQRFRSVEYETAPLMAVIGMAALPAGLDIASAVTPVVLTLSYGPLGVPIMAAGGLYRYLERFQIVQLTGHIDHPIVILDVAGTVRHANGPAVDLVPALATGRGEPLETVAPAIATATDDPDAPVTLEGLTGDRSYRVTMNPFASDATHLGRMITLTAVTNESDDAEDEID